MNDARFQFSIRSLLLVVCVACVASGCAVYFRGFWIESLMFAVVATCGILVFSHSSPLAFYLRYVNPLVAILVLGICLYAASTDYKDDKVVYEGFFQGPIMSYFVAKGLFCSIAVFLLGKLIEVTVAKKESE